MKKEGVWLVVILSFLFFVSFVSAIECGSVPTDGCDVTQNMTFAQGNYPLPNGINIIASNIVLNCNNSAIIGLEISNSWGIEIMGNYDFNTITNCYVFNYSYGIILISDGSGINPDYTTIKDNIMEDNSLAGAWLRDGDSGIVINNTIRNNSNEGIFVDSDYNIIENNSLDNNNRGMRLRSASFNNITQNSFENNVDDDLYLTDINPDFRSDFNNIWNNTIRNKISYTHTNNNNYVVDGVENVYVGNATGPTLEGLYIYNNLIINTERDYIFGNYTLSNGIIIGNSNLEFDCNNSITLIGSRSFSTYGITINENSDFVTVTNCHILNYSDGITLFSAIGGVYPDYATIKNNLIEDNTATGIWLRDGVSATILNNTIKNSGDAFLADTPSNIIKYNILDGNTLGVRFRGISANSYILLENIIKNGGTGIYFDTVFDGNDYQNISENEFFNNSIGINIADSGASYNNIWNNKFIDNNASDSGPNNNWNISGQGNYWSDYDSEAEGCYDNDSDFICDTPFNLSGSAGSKDYFPSLGIQINEIIPIQVIEGVDMVKGKTTLVRSILKNTGTVGKNLTVKLYFDSNLKDTNNTIVINAGEEIDVDLWFVPDIVGSNKEIKIEVNET